LPVKDLEVRKVLVPVRPVRQNLVGRQCDRSDALGFTGVFRNLIFTEIGAIQELAMPLLDGRYARGQNERGALDECHGGQADNGLPGATGQDDDAAPSVGIASGVKDIGCTALIVTNVEGKSAPR